MEPFTPRSEAQGWYMQIATGSHQAWQVREAVAWLDHARQETRERDIQPDCEAALDYIERWGRRGSLAVRFRRALAIADQDRRHLALQAVVVEMKRLV